MRIAFYTVLFLFIFALVLNHAYMDCDFWARLLVGKTFFQTGNLLQNDIFSFTPTIRWIDHEWGSSLVFYFLQSRFGDFGLFVFSSLMTFSTYVFLIRIIKLRHNSEKPIELNFIFFVISILAVSSLICAFVRCQIFTFFFFVLWLYILERVRLKGQDRLLWILPVTMIFWANLHGGCVAGLGLLCIYIFGEFLNRKQFIKYIYALLLSLLAVGINPYGMEYYKFLFSAITLKREMITEWQPLFNSKCSTCFLGFKLYLLCTCLLTFVLLIKKRFKIKDWTKALVLLVMFTLCLKSIRFQPFFAFAVTAFLYDDFYSVFTKKLPEKLWKIKEIAVYVTIVIYFIVTLTMGKTSAVVPKEIYPTEEVEFIKVNKLKGNVFANFQFGSYIAYKLYPNNYIFMDGRYEEVYPDGTLEMVRDIHVVPPLWRNQIYKYNIDMLIIENKYSRTPGALELENFWLPVYSGGIFTLYLRKDWIRPDFKLPPVNRKYYNRTKYETDFDWNK